MDDEKRVFNRLRIRNFLINLAKSRSVINYSDRSVILKNTIAYSDLNSKLKLGYNLDDSNKYLDQDLDWISMREYYEGRPLLSVLIVSKRRKGIPGEGFFKMAKTCEKFAGTTQEEEIHFFDLELKEVCNYWKSVSKVPSNFWNEYLKVEIFRNDFNA